MGEKLTLLDYLNKPTTELFKHPDFSLFALQNAIALSELTTRQIETVKLGGNNG